MRLYIDVHAHIGDTINRVPNCGQTAEKYLARMSQSQVVAAILSPVAGGPQARGVADTREQNRAVAEACRRYPQQFPIGLAIIEVRHQQAGLDELRRAMDEDGLAGFMCHPGISGHAMAAELEPALEVVNDRKGMVLLHAMGGGSEQRIGRHAKQFPDVAVVAAHVSMKPEQHSSSIDVLAGADNVWGDFAQHPADADSSWDLASLVAGFGRDRLLFGGDSPYYDYRLVQQQIEDAAIDDAAKDRIAWRNAAELIQRFAPNWTPQADPPKHPEEPFDDLWATLPGQPTRLQ